MAFQTTLCLVRFTKTDDTEIIINPNMISAIIDNGDITKILLGSEWVEIKLTSKEFLSRLKETIG